jgi:peroxiredoxin Q/BCP
MLRALTTGSPRALSSIMKQRGEKLDVMVPLLVVRDGVEERVTLGDLLTRPTVVSVYMKNNTPSCDRQNESLAAHAGEVARRGFNLVAVSRDSCASHRKYAVKKSISYLLVSDPDDHFAHAAEAIVEKSMYGKSYQGPARAVFVLDREGTVLALAERVDTKDHGAQVLGLLDGLKKRG